MENGLNKTGHDAKNREVKLTVTETETTVTKEGCEHFQKSFETYEEAESYYEFMISDTQN